VDGCVGLTVEVLAGVDRMWLALEVMDRVDRKWYTYSTEVQQGSTGSTLSASSPASPPGIPIVQRYSKAAHCLPAHQPAHQVYLKYRSTAGQHTVRQVISQHTRYNYRTEVQLGNTLSASSPASPPGIPILQRYSRAAHCPPAHQPAHQVYLYYRGTAGQHTVRQLTSQPTRYNYSTEVQQGSTATTPSASTRASPPGIPIVQRYSREA
jgi:hypothetical protein